MNSQKIFTKIKKSIAFLTLVFMTTNSNVYATTNDYKNYPIYYEEGDPKYGDYLEEAYYSLPYSILNALNRNNCHIIILEGDRDVEKLYKELYNKYIKEAVGLTIPRELISFVEGCEYVGYYEKYKLESDNILEEEFNIRIVKITLYHEIGHLLDVLSTFLLSCSSEFKRIYEKDVINVINSDWYQRDIYMLKTNMKNEKEYFAEMFAYYFVDPYTLMEYCPDTYNYIDSFVKSIDDTFGDKYQKQVKF